MTTIAWDGRSLVADKRATLSGVRLTVTKICRGKKGNLVGVAGTSALTDDIFAWLCRGAPKPAGQSDSRDWCPVIEVTPQGECFRHERWGKFRIEDGFYAIGSGSAFALAAMALGKTAAEAVELAARFDTGTGDGLDVLALKPAKALPAPKRKMKLLPAPRLRAVEGGR